MLMNVMTHIDIAQYIGSWYTSLSHEGIYDVKY